jgi:methionyl aminopeptidase
MTRIKTSRELEAMRESGRILEHILLLLGSALQPGSTGIELASLAKKELQAMGGEPVLLGYQGFPDVICISINDAVVHGIPHDTPLRTGDIVSSDFCVGWAVVGTQASRSIRRLMSGTQASLEAGISVLRADTRVGDISHAVETVLNSHELGIVRDLVGHGVGHAVHEEPNIPNYGPAGRGPRLKAGMTIAIEPMATLGSERVYVDDDGWTVRTHDHSLAAHFEDTVLITESGFEILTRAKN